MQFIITRITTISLVSYFFFIYLFPSPTLGAETRLFDKLRKRLIEDGISRAVVEQLYDKSKASFDRKGIARYFLTKEVDLNYDQFLRRSQLKKAKNYMSKHAETLEEAQKEYGVDSAVITAILLVESRLGEYNFSRARPVLNTLSTLASLADSENRDFLWNKAIKKREPDSRNRFEKWALRKSDWAYKELKAFIAYLGQHRIDPLSLRGSYAGALGYAQFMPSNVLVYGQDGDGDGIVNLYRHEDAIYSIANYLKAKEWEPGLTRDQAYNIILKYNASRPYAETILEVAGLLKKKKN